MASSTPARGGGPGPALAALSGLSLSDGADEGAGDPPGSHSKKLPTVGARVRCEGLTGAAWVLMELNNCLGRVVSHAGGRAWVVMDGPGGRVVGVRPQNLVVIVGLLDLLALPDLFKEEVLRRLDPTDLALLRRVDRGFRTAVESSSDLPRAGVSEEVPLKVNQFVGSVKRLAWAKEHGCPWTDRTVALACEGGRMDVVLWALAATARGTRRPVPRRS